jgi:hypothetical protein
MEINNFLEGPDFLGPPGDDRNLTGCALGGLDEASLDRLFQAVNV